MDKPINSHADRIEAIFDAALAFDSPEQREGYLQKECGDDEPLLTEVRALLLAHDQAHDFLELKFSPEIEAELARLKPEEARIAPQKAELVKLRYFAGLSIEEAADVLNISAPTAKRHWTFARAWLYHAITAEIADR